MAMHGASKEDPAPGSQPPQEQEDAPVRRVLLLLVLLGAAGLLAELVLLEHYESVWQLLPVALLAAVLGIGSGVAARPHPLALRALRAVLVGCVAAGLLGLYLHYQGNAEFELEMDQSLRRLDLFWRSLRGATPALAPGALIQLGLLGLVYLYRHPGLRGGPAPLHDPGAAAPRG